MRYVLCGECVDKKKPGLRLTYERSELGEPAEWEYVMVGRARQPKAEQRYIAINGEKTYLSPAFYNCDTCNAEIRPGQRCGTWTVWTEETGPVTAWEHEYIEPEPASGQSPPAGGRAANL
jgi:hypothetical protein